MLIYVCLGIENDVEWVVICLYVVYTNVDMCMCIYAWSLKAHMMVLECATHMMYIRVKTWWKWPEHIMYQV